MDSDSDAYDVSVADSDTFEPSPAPKKATKAAPKTAAKATTKAAPKAKAAAAPKPKKQPLAKRNSNGVDSDIDASFAADTDADISIQLPPPVKKADGKSASETYQKLSQLEHVLKRPDTYIGSVEKHTEELWVFDPKTQQMDYRETTFVPGFYKIFDEILVNAADNKVRDPSMDHLKVTIDREQNTISVWNNGAGVPIEMHEKEKIYIPELIFGNLLTSSNYDDNEAKVTGGRNGYGAKLANIYSTEFTVETANKTSETKYKQTFNNNMHTKGKPKITKNSRKEEYTCITFKPDLARFGLEQIDDDMEALMMKRVYDMAGTVKDIKVTLNGNRIKIKNFKQYVEMYVSAINKLSNAPKTEGEDGGADAEAAPAKQTIIYEAATDKGRTWEVAFAVSDGQFRQVSFVNNIATIKGGKHVDHVADQVVNKLIDHVKKDKKNGPVKPHQVRQQLWVFINCQIVNPTFDGQTKETLTLKQSAFGSKWNLTDEFARKILKSGVVDNVLSYAKFKQEQALKKTDGHKRSRITGIPKLEDANNAGSRKGSQCTLILTEGDSAKALAVAGLTEVGRDNYGVFPLRGKLLNVRDASHDAIMKNSEIKAIKEILGLQHGKQYMTTDSLRYGSIMIMTDQDHDGSHIKGLIINFLDHFYPSLLRLPDFLVEFITPIVRCTKGKQVLNFFTVPEYEIWKEQNNNGAGWTVKYFKGLGTSTAQDAKTYFRAMNKHMLPFEPTQGGDRDLIDLAFNKKRADDRKEWLRQFRPGTFLDHRIATVPYSDFINKELILFSIADCARSIPSVVDGLKPGQRKVLFAFFKRNLKSETKVAQICGFIAGETAYHHGEQSLQQTIVGLAQNFVGSNNVNLLSPNGQFGTRMMGGKDAASARYIFTSLAPVTRTLFPASDDKLLNFLNDDGISIEPDWYIPIIPHLLLNGADGIGTGWSTYVPNYNPMDVLANIRRRMAGEEMVPMKPWYRGFIGDIEENGPARYKVSGKAQQLDEKTWEITELPVRVWTSTFKESLEERSVGTEKVPATIKDYKEYHTDTSVHFVVELNAKGQEEMKAKGPHEFFKLTNQISTSNMVLFDSEGKIKKYATPEEILDDFFLLRLSYYQKRKDFLIDELKTAYDRLSNQARFVKMIITRELIVSNRKKADIVDELREKDFTPFPKEVKAKVIGDVDDQDLPEEQETGAITDFDYLLNMAIYNLTKEKVEKLLRERDGKEAEINQLLLRTPQNLWDEDLARFEEAWLEMLAEDERRRLDVGTARKGKGAAAAKKGAKSGAAARRVLKKGSDDEMDVDEDSGDDFKPAAATKKRAPAAKKPSPKKRVAELDDDDMAALMETTKPKTKAKASDAPPPTKKAKATDAEPIFLGSDDDDDAKLAPIFKKASGASKTTSKPKPASKPASKASSSGSGKNKAFSLSDSEDDMILPAKTARAGSKKAAAKDKDDSDAVEPDDSFGALPKRTGRARATARKASYKIDSDDENDDDDE